MPSYSTRKQMIDRILNRREEIRNSEENFKIHKYAHVFRKLLYKFRAKRQKKQITTKFAGSNERFCKIKYYFLYYLALLKSNEIDIDNLADPIAKKEIRVIENINWLHREQIEDVLHTIQKSKSENEILKASPNKEKYTETLKNVHAKVNTGLQIQQTKESMTIFSPQSCQNMNPSLRRIEDSSQKQIQLRRKAVQKNTIIQQITENNFRLRKQQQLEEQQMQEELQMEELKQFKINLNLPQLKKYFTIIDPIQIQEQVEQEVFEYLTSPKFSNHVNQEQFLNANPSALTKSIRTMESKIRHKIRLLNEAEINTFNKQSYSLHNQQEQLQKKRASLGQLEQLSQLSKIKLIADSKQQNISRAFRSILARYFLLLISFFERQENAKKSDREDSFASFTEIKLNKLYAKSSDIQNQLQKIEKQDKVLKFERFAEIIRRKKQENQLVLTAKYTIFNLIIFKQRYY